MKSKRYFKRQVCTLIASLILAMNVYANNKSTLIIGKVSTEQSKADWIELTARAKKALPELKDEGIKKTKVYLAKSVVEMIDAINNGKVDWVSDSLFVSLLLAENTRSDAFLSNNRGIRKQGTVFFTRQDSESKSIHNIRKKIILFKNQTSTNRFFVPFYELTSHGYIPIVYGKTVNESGKKKNIFYRFEEDDNKLIQEVMANALNIGVLSDGEYSKLSSATKSGLKVIHQTVAFPETLDLIRYDLDIGLKLKLKKLLLNNKKIKKNRVRERAGVSRFEKFVAEGRDGYIFLRGIIKHGVVPTNIKAILNKENLEEIKDQEIYDRIMADP